LEKLVAQQCEPFSESVACQSGGGLNLPSLEVYPAHVRAAQLSGALVELTVNVQESLCVGGCVMREATYDLEVIIAVPARLAGKCSSGQDGNEDDYFLVPGL